MSGLTHILGKQRHVRHVSGESCPEKSGDLRAGRPRAGFLPHTICCARNPWEASLGLRLTSGAAAHAWVAAGRRRQAAHRAPASGSGLLRGAARRPGCWPGLSPSWLCCLRPPRGPRWKQLFLAFHHQVGGSRLREGVAPSALGRPRWLTEKPKDGACL